MYYKTIGTGEPVIILHGGPGLSHDYLMPHLNSLANNFQLIFYDQRGTGLSEAKIDSESITVNQFVDDLEAIRNHFGFEKINILGHSWGGYLAMKYSLKNPRNVRSLVLVSSNGVTEESLEDYSRIRAERMASEDIDLMSEIFESEEFKRLDLKTMSRFVKLFFKPALYEQSYIDRINFRINENTAKNMLKIFELLSMNRKGYDLTDQLEEMEVPTLIIHCDQDPLLPLHAQVLNETIARSELVILEKCGHFPFVEQQEKFTKTATDFLIDLNSRL